MQGLLPPPTATPSLPPIQKVQIKALKASKRPTSFWHITFIDSSEVVYFFPPSMLALKSGGAEMVAPWYCHPCRQHNSHVYYHHTDKVHCLYCFNELEDNDTRPFAKVLQFPERK